MLIFRNHVPPPSRGRTGGGWGCPAQDSPHPHPVPPLEGEGEFLKRKISANQVWGCVAYPKCTGTRFIDIGVSPGPATDKPSSEEAAVFPANKKCPNCSAEMALRQFQTGPKSDQYFYGCVQCKKGYPAE